MKKALLIILVLAAGGFGAWLYYNQPIPEATHDQKAELMADKMLNAIGIDAWNKIPFIQWSFRQKHHYIWDKQHDLAMIKWDDIEVKMDVKTEKGKAYKEGVELTGEEADEALKNAWSYWCNDSFWLNAPSKVHDGGTTLSVAKLEDGSDGLMVKYNSGGVTPGDTYLWALDDNGLPKYFKMWVSIIPVGGVKATWTDWKTLDGAKIATLHEMGPMSITIDNLAVADSITELGLDKNYFEEIQ